VSVSPLNFAAEGKKLLGQIRKYSLPDEAAPPPLQAEAADGAPAEEDVPMEA